MKRAVTFLLTSWAFAGALVTLVVMLYAGLFFFTPPFPWNFPGEPPAFEVMIYPAVLTALVNLPLLFIARLSGRHTSIAASMSRLCSVIAFVILAISIAGILERHGPRWKGVRNGIREYGDRIAAEAGGKDRLLTEEQYRRFRETIIPRPVPVTLPGYGTVHLRLAHGMYPYVGVDFGDGANALIDPKTMLCMYSD